MNISKLQLELKQKLKNKTGFFNFIKVLLLEDNHTSLLDMLHSSFFNKLKILYGEEFIEILNKIWEDTLNFTYESDPLKPAFRDINNMELYLSPAIYKLWCLLKIWKVDFNITTLIVSKKIPNNCTIEDIIAYKIDSKSQELLLLLSRYISSENDNITIDIIRGIIKSYNHSLHLKLFKLLLKKGVDTELKKSILSNADCGNIEAFKTLVKFILHNELYSSDEVVDSIYGWTGVKLISLSNEEVKLFFIIINDVLTDRSKKTAMYCHGNELEYVFFSLWAEGLKDFSLMKEKIFLLNKGKNNIEILNALHHIYLIGTKEERMEAAVHRLKKKIDPLYAYYVIQNYMIYVTYPNQSAAIKYTIKTQKEMTFLSENSFLKDKKILERHFDAFYNLVIDMHKYLYSYERPFCWSDYIKDPESIFYKLFDIVAYAGYSEDKIDRLCDIVLFSTDKVILFFLINFVKEGRSEKQKNFILSLLKEGSSLLKERATFSIKTFKRSLTPEEKEAVINLFDPLVKSSHRTLIISHILGFQRDLMLEIVCEIILAKNNPLKKDAAEAFLRRLRKDNSFPFYLQEYKKKKDKKPTKGKKKESLPKENKIIIEKEKVYLQKFIKKSGFGIYNSQKSPFLFDSENAIISEISFIKNFFNLDIKEFEDEIDNSTSKKFLQQFPLNNLLEIDFALKFENFFDLESKPNNRINSVFSLFISNSFNIEKMRQITVLARKKDSSPQKILEKINYLYSKFNAREIFNMKIDIINCFLGSLFSEAYQNIEIINFVKALFDLIPNQDLDNINMFRTFFSTYYTFYYKSGFCELKKLNIIHFLRAFNMKLITEEEVYKELLERKNSFNQLSDFFNLLPEERKKYSFDSNAELKIITAIVKMEINRKRDSKKSELSHLIPTIKKIEGLLLLFSILETMDHEGIEIATDFSLKSLAKKDTLNYLLSISQPSENNTVEDIKELVFLLDNPYSLKRFLLFTAIHIPKWRPLLSDYLNSPYLDEVYWFFKAHLNYEKSLENRITLLKYTSIKPEEFEKGRFDIKWFKRVYNLLGELEFEQIYDSYKPSFPKSEAFERLTASLSGVFNLKDIESLEKEIKKQNKKALLCYSLLPYRKKITNKSIENIYDTIRYHVQTDDLMTKSQLDITNVALNNFLDNLGFSSRVFLELSFEKRCYILLRNFLKNDGTTPAHIALSSKNKLILIKYPSEEDLDYQREEYIMNAYEHIHNYNILIKDLIEYLKFCMHTRIELIHNEIFSIGRNPLTFLIVKNIIFEIDGCNFGFVKGESFVTTDDEIIEVNKLNKIKIAHPIEMPPDIVKKFKNYFKKNGIIQEFKQLEMETYILKNKEAYKKEIIHFLDIYFCYNTLSEFLINHNWEKLDESIFIKPYLQDNLVIQLETKYNNTTSNGKKTASISSITFLNIQDNESESFSKIPIRILSDILYDLNHSFILSENKKLK